MSKSIPMVKVNACKVSARNHNRLVIVCENGHVSGRPRKTRRIGYEVGTKEDPWPTKIRCKKCAEVLETKDERIEA